MLEFFLFYENLLFAKAKKWVYSIQVGVKKIQTLLEFGFNLV
jgi:hypothetical protein